ncbi:diguanylate cyclase [Paenibacillus marinisediminis]
MRPDVLVNDLPWVKQLLQTAYIQWLIEIPKSVRALLGTPFLYDYAGVSIEGEEAQLESVESDCLQKLIAQAISEHTSATIALELDKVLVAIPMMTRSANICIGVLVYRVASELAKDGVLLIEGWAMQLRTHFYREYDLMVSDEARNAALAVDIEAKRRQVLLDVVRHLHDHIEVDSVLSQIVNGILMLLPDVQVEVFLSQDHHSENPHVKELTFNSESDPLVMQAFMNGEACYLQRKDQYLEVVLALTGKQGSYGVLKLTFSSDKNPDPSDMQMVQLIVETAGTAFENARLHEQANAVIQELRFINDLTKRINQSLRLRDVFHDATQELIRVFRADFCMLLQLDANEDKFEVVSSNRAEYNGVKLPGNSGLFGYMRSLREPIIISDTKEQSQERVHFFEQIQLRSIIAVPLFGGGEMVGIVVVADKRPHFFSYDNYKLLQMLATHLGLAIANAKLHARVKHLANKDQVTGLYARHYLDKQINRQLNNDFCGSLIVVDIDLFKQINDVYGHQIGDKILKQVAEIIRTSIREADIAARWGGEEFAVYLPQLNVAQTMKVAERIRNRVLNETDPGVTVSCGISEWNWQDDKISVESLFYRADMAMYEAKDNGRNRIRIRS